MIRGRLQNCLLIFGYFAYLLMGAYIFQVLEWKVERKSQDRLSQLKEDFLKNFTSLTPAEVEVFVQINKIQLYNEKLLGAYEEDGKQKDKPQQKSFTLPNVHGNILPNKPWMRNLMEVIRMGIYPNENDHPTKNNNWDFGNSFFFAGSMLATIGYGNLVPKTAGGQLFCVVFALFGIPLNIVFLHHIGKILSLLCERFAQFLHQRGLEKKRTRFLTLMFFLLMGIVVFLCAPSAIFQEIEGWTYNEAIYFAFITLSTIGFGDYVIGMQREKNYFPGYRILVAIWIIFGLAWIALLFNLLTALLEDPDKKSVQKFLDVKTDNRETAGFPLEDDPLFHPVGEQQKNQL